MHDNTTRKGSSCVWFSLASIHGVPWSENITLLWWKIAASYPPIVRIRTKVLYLTHCPLKNNGISAARKKSPDYVVTRKAILNPLLTKMSNLWRPTLLVNGHQNIVTHLEYLVKKKFWARRRVQQCPRGCTWEDHISQKRENLYL